MVPSLRAIPLAFLLIATVLAAVPNDPATTSTEAQGSEQLQHMRPWQQGDYWKYWKETVNDPTRTKGEIVYRVQGSQFATNHRFHDPDKGDLSEWRSHQVLTVQVWANQTSATHNGPADVRTLQTRLLRTDDLGIVQNHARSEVSFLDSPANNVRIDRFHEFFPPQPEMVFPFAPGDEWRIGTQMRSHNPGNDCGGQNAPPCNTTNHRVHTYKVLGTEERRMNIGGVTRDVFTYRIHVIDERSIIDFKKPEEKKYEIWWYAPEACNVVQKEKFDQKGKRTESWTLTDFRCKGGSVPDPSYRIYDGLNFSATRLHGELAIPPGMADLVRAVESSKEARSGNLGGQIVQLGEDLPAPGFLTLASILVALAALVARRRTDQTGTRPR